MMQLSLTRVSRRILAAAILALSLAPVGMSDLALAAPAVTQTSPAQGSWKGELKLPGRSLAMEFAFSQAADGAWSGTLLVVEQTPTPLPFSRVTVEGDRLVAEASNLRATFEAKLSPDGKVLDGRWKQGPANLELVMARQEAPSAPVVLRRPQDPAAPYPYAEEEVSYVNPQGKITLAGTLTVPRRPGPHPALLLITGSGAQNRDSELLGHRPFKVIADDLTRRGFAVLRVDDRGVGGSSGTVSDATSADFAGDVKAGLRFLKSRSDVDAKRIGLIGHSEGGLIAPMVAANNPDVAFMVLLAAPGLRGDATIALQSDVISRKLGRTEAQLKEGGKLQREVLAIAASSMSRAQAAPKILALLETQLPKDRPEEAEAMRHQFAMQVDAMLTPWYRYFLNADPLPYLSKVTCPVLALNGENDVQVPHQQNLQAISKALKAAGNPDVTVKSFPKLNHLFQTSQTGMVDEYATIDETFAPLALSTMGDWLARKVFR
ncbi:Alpha/beta hydrolase family protein [compost metagenome]